MPKRMGDKACHQFILDHFKAHAIKGSLKPDRTYEVVEAESTHLKIRTRNKSGRWLQTLFADLQTCKSLKYGEFRRVDLFWGMQRSKKETDASPTRSTGAVAESDSFVVSIPSPTFLSNGDLMPVDAFINLRLGKSKQSRKEKSA